jgi:hypothetical protein
LRSLLGAEVPWFTCSATLDTENSQFFDQRRSSIERPELVIESGRIIAGSHRNIEDGRGVGENLSARPDCVSKTMVFFDSKKDVQDAIRNFQN